MLNKETSPIASTIGFIITIAILTASVFALIGYIFSENKATVRVTPNFEQASVTAEYKGETFYMWEDCSVSQWGTHSGVSSAGYSHIKYMKESRANKVYEPMADTALDVAPWCTSE